MNDNLPDDVRVIDEVAKSGRPILPMSLQKKRLSASGAEVRRTPR